MASPSLQTPSRIYTPDTVASATPPLDPYLFLRSIYNSSKPAADNNGQALSTEQVIRLWHEAHSALDQIAALQTSTIRVGELQQEIDRATASEEQLHDEKHDLEASVHALTEQVRLSRTVQPAQQPTFQYTPPPQRTAEHPDPPVFNGTDTSLLPDFLMQMSIKLAANADWYPLPHNRLAYYISRLAKGALQQVKFGILNSGFFSFTDVDELAKVLKTSYGDATPKVTAGTTVLSLKQNKQPLQKFLPEWQQVAAESQFDDIALIAILRNALHPLILERLSYNPAAASILSLAQFLDLVRDSDSMLRTLYGNYHTQHYQNLPNGSKTSTNGTKPTPAIQPPTPLPPAAPLTTSDGGDAMDLSVIWTGSQGGKRRPRNDAERKAKREYCWKRSLCLFCESPDHRIDACTTRPENSRQPRQNTTVAAAETEN
jgi:hypothetical protein